jgi:hypothetical protein
MLILYHYLFEENSNKVTCHYLFKANSDSIIWENIVYSEIVWNNGKHGN